LRKEKLKEEERKKKEGSVEVRKTERKKLLRKVMVKNGLERIDTQKRIIVETLLDNYATRLVMSLEFAKKQRFKLKKIKKPIYVRNLDGSFNKKGLIEYMAEINIYY